MEDAMPGLWCAARLDGGRSVMQAAVSRTLTATCKYAFGSWGLACSNCAILTAITYVLCKVQAALPAHHGLLIARAEVGSVRPLTIAQRRPLTANLTQPARRDVCRPSPPHFPFGVLCRYVHDTSRHRGR